MPEYDIPNLSVKRLWELRDELDRELERRQRAVNRLMDSLEEAINQDIVKVESYFSGPDYMEVVEKSTMNKVTIRLEI